MKFNVFETLAFDISGIQMSPSFPAQSISVQVGKASDYGDATTHHGRHTVALLGELGDCELV